MSSGALTTTATAVVTLADVEALANRWCDHSDPKLLVGADAARDAEQLARVIRRLQVKQVALAARAKEANSFSGRFPTAAAWQAHINGCSQSEAKRGLDTVEQLAECPETAAAWAAGELSIGEAHLVTSAVVVNPGWERRLVDQARRHNFADTRTAADRARHAVFSREAEAARVARMHRLRRVRELTDGDQLTWVDAHVVPDTWVMVRPILDAYADAEYRTARLQGRRESPDAYRADGLIAALRAAGDAIGVATPPPPRPPDPPPSGGSSLRNGRPRPAGGGTRRSNGDGPSGPSSSAGGSSASDPGGRSMEPIEAAVAVDVAVRGDPSGSTEPTEPIEPTGSIEETEPAEPTVSRSVRRPRASSEPVVLVDAIALRRGWATETETCELARTGTRLSIDSIDELLLSAAVDVLVHDRHDIRAHAIVHRRRRRSGSADVAGPSSDMRSTVVVLIDAVALTRPPTDLDGDRHDDNQIDHDDGVPVPGTNLHLSRRWLHRLVPDDIAEVVEHRLIDLRHHTSATRHLPRPVRLALLARDRRCTVPGCRNRQHLERDHVHDFALGGPGNHLNMHGTCGDHHDDKTYRDARVVITDTDRL